MFKIGLRESEPVPLAKPISDFLTGTQNISLSDAHRKELQQLESLRSEVVANLDCHESSLKKLQVYAGQLALLASKVPFDEQNNAAGYFHEIETKFLAELERNIACAELSRSTIAALVQLNLALAQECFYHKAVLDKMKDGTIAKIAAKCAELYSGVLEKASTESSKQVFPSERTVSLQCKSFLYQALSNSFKAKECEAASKYGESVSRLQFAESLFKSASEQSKNMLDSEIVEIKSMLSATQTSLKRAQKDNDVIYLEKVPSITDLVPIEKVQLVQIAPVPSTEVLIGQSTPILQGIYPYSIHKHLSAFQERESTFTAALKQNILNSNASCDESLKKIGLPGVLEALEQPAGIPKSVLEKSESIKSQGGAQYLHETLATLQGLSAANANIFSEVRKILEEEASEDRECRQSLGEKWKRTPSFELQKGLQEKLSKLQEKFRIARDGDQVVLVKFQSSLPFITALSCSKEELEASIPNSTQASIDSLKDETAILLKSHMQSLERLKKDREKLIVSMTKRPYNYEDLSQELVVAVQNQTMDFENIFRKYMAKYDELSGSCPQSIQSQEQLLNSISNEFTKFKSQSKFSEAMKARQQALQNLDMAYRQFQTLQSNFDEGIKFHSDLNGILNGLKEQAADLAMARGLEKKEMLKMISEQAALVSSAPQQHQFYHQVPQPGVWTPSIPLSYGNSPAPSAPTNQFQSGQQQQQPRQPYGSLYGNQQFR